MSDSLPVLKFIRRTGGTGGTIDETFLGHDEELAGSPPSAPPSTWKHEPQGALARVVVDTFYFADPTTDLDEARLAAAAYVEAFRTAVNYRPPIVKELTRNATVLVHLAENFGDLVVDPGGDVVLADCQLVEASVTDDVGIHGIGVQFVFAAVTPTCQPAA